MCKLLKIYFSEIDGELIFKQRRSVFLKSKNAKMKLIGLPPPSYKSTIGQLGMCD